VGNKMQCKDCEYYDESTGYEYAIWNHGQWDTAKRCINGFANVPGEVLALAFSNNPACPRFSEKKPKKCPTCGNDME